jgi:hypothetical protein
MYSKLVSLALFACGIAAHADTLYLRDGRTVQGTFISGNSRELRFLADGGRTQRYAISAVERVNFGDSTSAVSASGSRSNDSYRSNDTYVDRTRTRARSTSTGDVVPSGSVITVRLIDPINSDKSNVGDTFRASLDEPIVVNGRTVAPAGSDATVRIVRVEQSGTVSGSEEIALVLSEVMANGRRLMPETQHAEVSAKSRSTESAKIIGGTAVVGAIIGAIAGGGKGAAIGAASGAGAGVAIQAIRGQRIQIPSETRLDFTLSQPMRT